MESGKFKYEVINEEEFKKYHIEITYLPNGENVLTIPLEYIPQQMSTVDFIKFLAFNNIILKTPLP